MGTRSITAAAAAVIVLGAIGPAAAAPASFTDPAGDAGTGFDITGITVSNDARGKITFRVALPAVTAPSPDLIVGLLLNTDGKPTGNNGVDYAITVFDGTAAIVETQGSGPGRPFIPRSLSTLFTPGVLTVSVNRRDLDNAALIQFLALSFVKLPDGTIDQANTDSAPSARLGAYLLDLPTTLFVRSSSLSPGRPAAGGAFSARMFVRDTTYGGPGVPVAAGFPASGLPAEGGVVTCAFTVAGRAVRARGTLDKGGRATCAGTVPAGTAGARLAGTVRYRLRGATISRPFSAVVR